MEDLMVILHWSASPSVSYHNGEPQVKIKGSEMQKGASGSAPIPLGLSHVPLGLSRVHTNMSLFPANTAAAP